MSLVPVAQTVMRKLLGQDLPGSSVWVQHGTLWVGFLGALIATGRGKHLGLSTVEFLPERFRLAARIFGAMVTTAVVALLAYAAFELVKADRLRQDTLVGGISNLVERVRDAGGVRALTSRCARRGSLRGGGGAGRLACSRPSRPLASGSSMPIPGRSGVAGRGADSGGLPLRGPGVRGDGRHRDGPVLRRGHPHRLGPHRDVQPGVIGDAAGHPLADAGGLCPLRRADPRSGW